jgi:hypothetical protein
MIRKSVKRFFEKIMRNQIRFLNLNHRAKGGLRAAFLPRRLRPGRNAVAATPICGQQIGQMAT